MNNPDKILEEISLAEIYFEDGAPRTALNILLKLKKCLTKKQHVMVTKPITDCRNEIKRKNYHYKKHGLPTI